MGRNMGRENAVTRFSNRVENYARFRPGYPDEIGALLERECGLGPGWNVADVGSGTGLLSELFLRRGCRVLGVEPNREMRKAGEHLLAGHEGFVSVDGRAEATTLPSGSVDLVAAGQAFHWFDREATRAEFVRILKPGGWVALAWNKRRKNGTPYLEGYERLLQRWSVDYAEVDHDRVTDEIVAAFYAPGRNTVHTFPNRQSLDLGASRGRLESASYTPPPDHPNYAPMIAELEALFAANAVGGRVDVEYDTLLYVGRLDSAA
jgi:SAM-dependent methyltransferase